MTIPDATVLAASKASTKGNATLSSKTESRFHAHSNCQKVVPKAKKRYAEVTRCPQEARAYEKRLRTKTCALCPGFKSLSRKDLRHKRFHNFNLETHHALLTRMHCIFPDYSTGKSGVPVVWCERHFLKVKMYTYDDKSNRKPKFTSEFTASQNKLFKNDLYIERKKLPRPSPKSTQLRSKALIILLETSWTTCPTFLRRRQRRRQSNH